MDPLGRPTRSRPKPVPRKPNWPKGDMTESQSRAAERQPAGRGTFRPKTLRSMIQIQPQWGWDDLKRLDLA